MQVKKLIIQFSWKSRDKSFEPSWSTIRQYLLNKTKVVLFIRFIYSSDLFFFQSERGLGDALIWFLGASLDLEPHHPRISSFHRESVLPVALAAGKSEANNIIFVVFFQLTYIIVNFLLLIYDLFVFFCKVSRFSCLSQL